MANRVDKHAEVGLLLGGHPASTECYDSTLRFVDIVHSDADVRRTRTPNDTGPTHPPRT